MNVKEGLQEIKRRLEDNGAHSKSIQVVETIQQRASLPAASSASATSLLQLVRMLMRSPVSNSDPLVYNDFVRIESDLEQRADQFRAEREAEDARPVPKSRKYYKALKESDEKKG
ncbi:MAG: hypothetical protein M3440_01230 [Chloroflexota bacterium]|nr:hypothetical protein [Chloroflexota bacterium]